MIRPIMTKQFFLKQPSVEATRYERILVSYEDSLMRSCQREFEGRVAQAIQHEIDHCNGVVI